MKPCRLGAGRRAINHATTGLITLGLARHYELLTVTGRTTGQPRSTRVRASRPFTFRDLDMSGQLAEFQPQHRTG